MRDFAFGNKPLWLATVAAIGMAAALPGQAMAQDGAVDEADSGGLSEIVVTAQRREENLRDVPISINAINSESLANLGVKDTNSLVQSVPSLNFTRSGPSGIFVIRGVSTPNGAAGEEGATAVYIDDVYMPDLAQTVNKFNNIERIEVLNGPQGTLFGRNATGGLIRVITRDPGDRTEFNGQVGYANYETFSGQAYFSSPLSENIGWNVAFTGQDQGKGFGFNSTLNKRTRQDDFWSLRSKLVAQAGDKLKLTLIGDYYSTNNDFALQLFPVSIVPATGVATGPISGQGSLAGFPSGTRIRAWGLSGKIEFDAGFATLSSITSYRKLTNNSSFDVDGRAADVIHLSYEAGTESFQQEVRLASASTDPLSWQIGAFYLHSVAHQDQVQGGSAFNGLSALPGGLAPNTLRIVSRGPVDSISLFGEATYAITATTHLTGGVRWTSDNRKLPQGFTQSVNANGVVFRTQTNPLTSRKYDEVTYRFALRQEIGDSANIYVSVNRGFKSGQFNLQSPQDAPVKPMTIMAYEAGIKAELLDNRLRLNLAGYHYDINDYQIRSSPGPTAGSLLLNAAKVKIDGVDLNMEAAVTERFRLTAGMSYLNSRFSNFGAPGSGVFAPGFYACGCGNATGNRTALAPEFAFSATANYTLPVGETGELRFTGGYSHKSRYYFEPDNVLSQPAYDLFSGSIEYAPTEHIAFEVFMKNIGDELYNVQMVTAGFQSAIAGEPRTYGVNFKIKY